MNTIAVGFQREGRLMEVEFVLASLYNLQRVSEEKQINQQAGRVGDLSGFQTYRKENGGKIGS